MSRNFLMTVAALLCGATTVSSAIVREPVPPSLGARSVGVAHSVLSSTDRWSIDDRRRGASVAAPCETFISITQAPASPYAGATAAITVAFGEQETTPVCLGQEMVDPTSVRFTVNGVDRTSYFTFGYGEATASAVPLVSGTTNTLVATMAGYTTTGDPRTDSDTLAIDVAAAVTFTPSASPKGRTVVVPATTSLQKSFSITNIGNGGTATYTLTAICDGSATGCSLSTASVAVPQGDSVAVTLAYTSGASATAGRAGMRVVAASGGATDSGWVNVSAGVTSPVVVVTTQDGEVLERSQCLTIAVSGGAYECGDYRTAIALPAVTTFGRTRTPTLLYNSALAVPRPIVSALVSTVAATYGSPGALPTPDSVTATVTIAGVVYAVGSWSGDVFWRGDARRISLPLSLPSSYATGVHDYVLEIAAVYGANRYVTIANGAVSVVNRAASEFGAGWWVAGVERLYRRADNSFAWIGGDGSVRVYRPDAILANVWRAPAVDRLDSLVWNGANYVRRDRGGVRVLFDTAGLHIATKNRLEHTTAFGYASGRLQTISVPGSTMQYRFNYDVSASRVISIEAPSAGSAVRTVQLAWRGADVVSVVDPTGAVIGFTPDTLPGSVARGRIVARTTARGSIARFTYDAGGKLRSAGATAVIGNAALTQHNFIPHETVSLHGTQALDSSAVYTEWQNPRSDRTVKTRFHIGRFGAPVRIVDAAGAFTTLARANAMFPGLPTTVVTPVTGGTREARYFYDAHGHTDSTVNTARCRNGDCATTVSTWDHQWDVATSVRKPEGTTSYVGLDPVTGNRLWQQVGPDSAGRIRFTYDQATGLLRSVMTPTVTRPDSVFYDTLGNVLITVGASNDSTVYERDGLGNVRLARSIVRQTLEQSQVRRYELTDSTYYDALGRDTLRVSRAPRDSTKHFYGSPGGSWYATDSILWNASTLRVRTARDADGNVTSVSRAGTTAWTGATVDSIDVVTSWEFDGLGRVTKEIAPGGSFDGYQYDGAGNVLVHTTRRGHAIHSSYDAMNRQTQRTVPAVSYPRRPYAGVSMPHYVNGATLEYYHGNNVVIPADTASFTYDIVGNVLTANNGAAHLERTYNADGSIASETQRIGTYADGRVVVPHSYTFRFDYDLDGRRTRMIHPRPLYQCGPPACSTPHAMSRYELPSTPVVMSDSVSIYRYDTLGRLDSLENNLGVWTAFRYDALSRIDSTLRPNGVTTTRTYNAEGLLARERTMSPNTSSPNGFPSGIVHDIQYTQYDSRGKISVAVDRSEYHAERYAPGGPLARSEQGFVGSDGVGRIDRVQYWDFNGLGDRLAGRTLTYETGWTRDSNSYEPRTGRLQRNQHYQRATGAYHEPVLAEYDSAGNLHLQHRLIPVARCGSTAEVCEYPFNESFLGEVTAQYYGADNQLMAHDRKVGDPLELVAGGLEEYRYDALGRRVLRFFRSDCLRPTQSAGCEYQGQLVRYVYDGDEPLYEIQRRSVNDTTGAAELERDLVYDSDAEQGVAQYLLGPTLDRPLAVTRVDQYTWGPGGTLFLHTNWQGHFDIATVWNGKRDSAFVDWGERQMTTSLQRTQGRTQSTGAVSFYGSLLDVQTDGSALVYMRNRYYDPASGRFTQEDPIGIAGGINVYGFANGDPVNFSDPYGLCPAFITGRPCSNAIAIGVGFIPLLGDAYDVASAAVGKDLLTGEKIDAVGIGVTLAGTVFGSGKLAREGVDLAKQFSKEKAALVEMAKRDKRTGITEDDMRAYEELNHSLPDPFPSNKVRIDAGHLKRGLHSQTPHGHVGPVEHIPVREPKKP